MITAEQAKQQTKEKVTQLASEFITNSVEPAIQNAINGGWKFANVGLGTLDKVNNPAAVGAEVVRLLEDQGFAAEHHYAEHYNNTDNYISLNWEN